MSSVGRRLLDLAGHPVLAASLLRHAAAEALASVDWGLVRCLAYGAAIGTFNGAIWGLLILFGLPLLVLNLVSGEVAPGALTPVALGAAGCGMTAGAVLGCWLVYRLRGMRKDED